jgi:excisionase family DNA binding protein
MKDELLTVQEVARLLRLTPRTIYRMVRENKLRPIFDPSLYRFSKLEVLGLVSKSALKPRRIQPNSQRDEAIANLKF